MTETNTQSTVTKLTHTPKNFYEKDMNTTIKDDVIKTNEKTELSVSTKIDKNTEPTEDVNKKTASLKSFVFKTAKEITNQSKKVFSAVKKKSSRCMVKITECMKNVCRTIKAKSCFTLKKLRSESGIKFIIAGSIFAVCLVVCSFTCSVGYKVTVGNKSLGVIPSMDMYSEVSQEINENVFSMTGKEFTLPSEPKLSMTIALNRNVQTKEQFAENLKSASSDMIPAYTVVIDNKMIVSLPNEDMALSAVNEYKNSFSSGIKETKLEFANDVNVVYMFAPKELLHSKDAAVTYLLNGEFSYYKSDREQTVSELSQKTGVAESIILKSNILDGNTILKDQTIKLYTGKMFADVMAVQEVQREEAIPYETLKQNSDEIYQGITKIETVGSDGIKTINESVTYVNGIETKRDVLSENVLKAPIAQVELIGTKEPPPSVGTGSLVLPTSGSLSSRFGSRWGRQHQGIDLSASVGTPIYAADNGTVTYAEFNDGGYGYMIQIDHSNGLQTYYAHCSELLVNEGDIVAKGDLIAKVGNTGRSTGAHLHFEVRQDGTPIDPMTYIN